MNATRRIGGLLLAALAIGLRAEANPPPLPANPAEDALTAVQRDYEVIKGTQSSLERQRLDLPAPNPSARTPALGDTAAMAELNPPLSQTRPGSRPSKSANWLLDAMGETTADPLNELRSGMPPGGNGRENSWSAAQDSAGLEQTLRSPAPKPGDAVENPLTAYMAAWMTPHDLELLKDKGAEANTPLTPNQPPAGMRPAGGPGADPRANPYLADLAPGLSEGPKDLAPAPGQALAVPGPKGDFAPLENQPPPAEQFKLPDDSKYFPQLKRF